MLHTVSVWLFVAAFAVAGVINATGTTAVKSDFVRWGYPAWWCYVTGGLELLVAVLIARRSTEEAGLILGAVIVAVALGTVLRHRQYAHLAPLGVFAALIATTQLSS